MPKITAIEAVGDDTLAVFVDGKFEAKVRKRTIGKQIKVGDDVELGVLADRENNCFRNLYGAKSWEKEKGRLHRVEQWFRRWAHGTDVLRVGFGADSTESFQNVHPDEKGAPDLSICVSGSNREILALEVSGSDRLKGRGYWLRPDKIDYIQKHKERDIWVVLHYGLGMPDEKFVWIKIDPQKQYQKAVKNLYGVDEHFVIFDDNSPEVVSSEMFHKHVLCKMSAAKEVQAPQTMAECDVPVAEDRAQPNLLSGK